MAQQITILTPDDLASVVSEIDALQTSLSAMNETLKNQSGALWDLRKSVDSFSSVARRVDSLAQTVASIDTRLTDLRTAYDAYVARNPGVQPPAPVPAPPAPVPAPPAPAPAPVTFRRPKTHFLRHPIGWGAADTTLAPLAAKCDFFDVGMYGGSDQQHNEFCDAVHALSPSTKLGVYGIVNEQDRSPTNTRAANLARVTVLNEMDLWLRKADGSLAAWTNEYDATDINLCRHTEVYNGSITRFRGLTWPVIAARLAYEDYFQNRRFDASYWDDNSWLAAPVDGGADYLRNGTNIASTDARVSDGYCEFRVKFVNELRRLGIVNIWSNLTNQFGKNKLDRVTPAASANKGLVGGWMEHFVDTPVSGGWGFEKNLAGGFAGAVAHAAQLIANARDGHVVASSFVNRDDWAACRMVVAASLMTDCYISLDPREVDASGKTKQTPNFIQWCDELDAPLGAATQTPPTAPNATGMWSRAYQNGISLFNASYTANATIPMAAGYKRLAGTRDKVVNNGAVVPAGTLTLGPRQGLVLIKA